MKRDVSHVGGDRRVFTLLRWYTKGPLFPVGGAAAMWGRCYQLLLFAWHCLWNSRGSGSGQVTAVISGGQSLRRRVLDRSVLHSGPA